MRGFETQEYRLIEDVRVEPRSLNDAYGASRFAAQYCGFDEAPYLMRGQWQHGWVGNECMVDPAYVIWDDGKANPDEYHWVSREELASYLRANGYPRTQAIGVGMVYVPEIDIPRMPNSLLIMPGHSLYTTEHDWDFEAYMSEIKSVRDDFDYVAVCVHPACLEKGYWIDAFRKEGIEIVSGALFTGRHALYRMKWLMKRFEYVTTNLLGTHVGYAAYGGAKVSVYGRYIKIKKEEWGNCENFIRRPDLLDHFVRLNSEEVIRQHYGFLFSEHPKDAKTHEQWGALQLGEDCKKSPEELSDLFMWPKLKCGELSLSDYDESSLGTSVDAKFLDFKQIDETGQIKSFFELRELAQSGDAQACYGLALLMKEGLLACTCRDEEAYYWAVKATQLGHAQAWLLLALFYVLGKGVKQDLCEAKKCLEIAQQAGVSSAGELIGKLK